MNFSTRVQLERYQELACNEALKTARVALEQAEKTLASYEGVLAEEAALNYQLTEALEQVSAAAHSISVLTDYIERHPGSVLRGKGGR